MGTLVKMKNLALYEVSDQLIEIQNELIENGGELTEEIEERLTKLEMKFRDKAVGICKVIRSMAEMASAIKTEENRLKNLRQARERCVEGLREYLRKEMSRLRMKKLDTDLFRLSRRKNPVKAELVDEEAALDDFFVVKRTFNSTKAMKHLKAINQLPEEPGDEIVIFGVKLSRGESLQIK